MKKLLLAASLVALAFAAAPPDGTRWWQHVSFLASDDLEGRNTGSAGHKKAAMYVAEQFERLGLQPGGTQGYIQPVPFTTLQVDEENSSLSLLRGGKETPVTFGEQAFIGARTDPADTVEAELVFVGNGLTIPEIKHDDFKGLDTKGKIAVVFAGAPSNLSGPLGAHYQSAPERAAMLKAAGIIGTVNIANPKHADIPWERIASNRTQAAMQLAGPAAQAGGTKIGVTWNPARANELFAGTGHTIEEIIDAAEAGKPMPHFAIPAKLKAKAAVKRGAVESQNIIAILPGNDAKLKNEFVVVSAHVDHLGVGTPVNGDAIFNGAMDNASGVATVLDAAAYLKELGVKPKRSIAFVIVTGEEKGLLGSRYFATNPTLPANSIVADLNTDMFLPLYPLKRLTVYGLAESTLGDDIRAVAKTMQLDVQEDPEPQRNSFIRSDQYSFILQGIPSVAMKDGYLKGTKEEKMFKDWLTNRYHSVTDDLNQPVDKQAAGKFNTLVANLLLRVADNQKKPEWKPDSFFKRYSK